MFIIILLEDVGKKNENNDNEAFMFFEIIFMLNFALLILSLIAQPTVKSKKVPNRSYCFKIYNKFVLEKTTL